jgi:farnesol dehydrogenase
MVRDPRKLERLFFGGLEMVQGELSDRAAAAEAVREVDTVLHLAALASAHAPDPGQYMRANAEAVDVLLQASAAAGVRRFVQVSTIAALPPVRPAAHRDRPGVPTLYARSKVAAESLVRQYVAGGREAVIVRPTRVYGPGPWNDANGTTRLMALYLRGRFRFRPDDGGVQANYVHVSDVVQGILQAAAQGRSGAAYQLGGEDSSLRGFLAALSEVSGIRRRVWPVSPRLLTPLVGLAAGWGRCGGQVTLTTDWLDYFLEHRPADIEASRRDFGYQPLNLREGIAATLPWLLTSTEGGRREHQIHVRRRQAWA